MAIFQLLFAILLRADSTSHPAAWPDLRFRRSVDAAIHQYSPPDHSCADHRTSHLILCYWFMHCSRTFSFSILLSSPSRRPLLVYLITSSRSMCRDEQPVLASTTHVRAQAVAGVHGSSWNTQHRHLTKTCWAAVSWKLGFRGVAPQLAQVRRVLG
jgi:hypothetical protein